MPKLLKIKQFAISLQYLKKEVNDEADYLHTGRHENSLRTDAMILLGMVKHFQSSQNSKFAMSLQYLKKEVRYEVDFLHADKHKVAYKLISTLIIIDGHDEAFSWYSQSIEFVNLCKILKKKLGMEFIFFMQMNIKVSKSWHYRF